MCIEKVRVHPHEDRTIMLEFSQFNGDGQLRAVVVRRI